MDEFRFLDGMVGLQRRLVDTCRSLAENEMVFTNAKEILKVLALEDLKKGLHRHAPCLQTVRFCPQDLDRI